MQRLSILVFATLAILPSGTAAQAQTLQCACQQVTVCGPDACEPSSVETCLSTDIGLDLTQPAIRLCIFSDCLEGPVSRTDISGRVTVLEGEISPANMTEAYPSHVLATLDRETGIGLLQSSDEQAVAQYTVICQAASGF